MPLTYAIGDIHGCLDKLCSLLLRCEKHAAGRPMSFVFVGDYIDRGPQSCGVIDCLIDLKAQRGENVVTLTGNHEAMALAVIDGRSPSQLWFAQGGLATLKSYGVMEPRELPRGHVDWLRALPLRYDDGRRFFVHAGVNPATPLETQDDFDLLWIREPFLSHRGDYGRLIVHGHTPLVDGVPELHGNRLNLDTGAVFGGPLTAAIFDEAQTEPVGFLQAE
jgi:diadenosine tetraphosphatase ApaH/serine/threonine PP2A family protein phosphatase